ncbi:MAG: bifunctional phosphoribosylaminoimidazolecarboxamide formyltransferase/IMP cyclohydrolase [Thermoanaerobaculia bacterium]
MPAFPAIARALLSVSDKTGLADFARGLVAAGFELVSTGGTRKHLEAAGLAVTGVSEVTGFPEILDGRVKTLHPKIHGGILADRAKPAHTAALAEHGIERFDLVVVNLYPFESTIARPGIAEAEAVEMIDIGGPAMLRAAAKNFGSLAVLVDPGDYARFLVELGRHGGVASTETRRRLAQKAFAHTAAYDAAIAGWLAASAPASGAIADDVGSALLPERLTLSLVREFETRYGENPHQPAAVYRLAGGPGLLGGMRQLQGKELSWNNLLDADAARKLVALFEQPAVVIVKHNNPCGVGRGPDLVTAYARALECDPVSAFGSIVAINRPLTGEVVTAFGDLFIEVLLAPLTPPPEAQALASLATRKNLRLLLCPPYAPQPAEIELRGLDGGFLAQSPDGFAEEPATWTCPTKRQPTEAERRALGFAWAVTRYTKSNAIVLTDGDRTLGVGAGQMSRVDSCRIAIAKARFPLSGAVAGSDAFFPFRDGLDELAAAGIAAVIQPGGSRRDDELVAAADEHGMAMIFTGRRHFRH